MIATTGFLIPFELYEVARKLSFTRVTILVVNVAIVAYLVSLFVGNGESGREIAPLRYVRIGPVPGKIRGYRHHKVMGRSQCRFRAIAARPGGLSPGKMKANTDEATIRAEDEAPGRGDPKGRPWPRR